MTNLIAYESPAVHLTTDNEVLTQQMAKQAHD